MFLTARQYDRDRRKAAQDEADKRAVLEDALTELQDRLKRERRDNDATWHLVLALREFVR